MFGKRIDLLTVFGITIRLDLSWFVVFILVISTLADSYFPGAFPGLSRTAHWVMGLAGAVGLFVSVVLHELGHALVARQYGLAIRGITLFVFGGVAEMESEPPDPKAEFMVAVAGPAVSVLIGVGCLVSTALASLLPGSTAASGVLAFLAYINLLLVLFNLIPAFPLDGGRVLRSILWQWKRNLRWATAVSSRIGSSFGVVLIGFGLFRAIAFRDLLGGIWYALIGMFLRNAAQISYRQMLLRRNLEGEPVHRFMQTDPVVVPRAISVAELVEQYVYRHHFKFFPVVDNGRLVGCVTTGQIKQLPPEEWARQSVGTITLPCSPNNTVSPGSDATEALALMSRTGASRLLVVENDRLVGIITLKDLLRFLALKVELEGENGRLTGSN